MRAVELAALVAAAAGLAILRGVLLRRRVLPRSMAKLIQSIPDALGDGVIALDSEGRILFATPTAAGFLGLTVPEMVDRQLADLAPELAAIARGVNRAPASARILLCGPEGSKRVNAAVIGVSSGPARSLAVLRLLPPPPPPPLDPTERSGGGEEQSGLAASVSALREPIADAAQALALLRLAIPALEPRGSEALVAAERALEVGSRRLSELETAARPGASRRSFDLTGAVEEIVETLGPPPGIRIRLDLVACKANADERSVRAAVREILRATAVALPAGGEINVAARGSRNWAMIEIRAPATVPAGGLALARALVAAQGGRIEGEVIPGRGSVVRIALAGIAI